LISNGFYVFDFTHLFFKLLRILIFDFWSYIAIYYAFMAVVLRVFLK